MTGLIEQNPRCRGTGINRFRTNQRPPGWSGRAVKHSDRGERNATVEDDDFALVAGWIP